MGSESIAHEADEGKRNNNYIVEANKADGGVEYSTPPSAKTFSTRHSTLPQLTTISRTTNETSSYMPYSILIHKQQAWQKKGDTTFDVTMGSYDGAET